MKNIKPLHKPLRELRREPKKKLSDIPDVIHLPYYGDYEYTKPVSRDVKLYSSKSGQCTFAPTENTLPIKEEPPKPRLTYGQEWATYDLAKTNENQIFKKLIEELCFLLEDQQPQGIGRHGYSLQEKVLAMVFKVYYKGALRKTVSFLKELQQEGIISRVPSYRSISNFFSDETVSKEFDKLILLSALPLANVEEVCGTDATGFGLSKYERWHNFKWGKHKGKQRVWVKAHAFGLCRTNAFISMEVTKANVADVSKLKEVVQSKIKYFNVNDFVADKAYLSRSIMEFLKDKGLTPIIPFKSNSRGISKGFSIWKKMYLLWQSEPEKMFTRYHVRSNLETNFHMLKQNFGHHLTTKDFQSNTNEIKAMVVCHNICVLIAESYKMGLELDFLACAKIARFGK